MVTYILFYIFNLFHSILAKQNQWQNLNESKAFTDFIALYRGSKSLYLCSLTIRIIYVITLLGTFMYQVYPYITSHLFV
jgi:hypothetical protein